MVNNVSVIETEDPSVKELLNKTAKELHEKYNKQRKINEKFLSKKTPLKRALSIFLDIICVIMLVVGFVVCFATINTTVNGYMPNFAGYTNLVISSRSMENSGFYVGDIVIIHSVDAKTLNVGDKIAFYEYPPSYINFNVNDATQINKKTTKHKYTLTISQLFGFQTDEIKQAAAIKSDIVFHHIHSIYEDENGEIWFKTYGSSNNGDLDPWWINENYIVGIQDEGVVAKCAVGLVGLASKPLGIIILAIPVGILILALAFSFMKNIQIAKLELDCVEEKRKITDPICVKNGVGYQMSTKTKFKILAQATSDNWDEYISLLWKNGKEPKSVKKYFMRKKILLNENKLLLKLNRECEKMFKNGVKPTKIANHYLNEKQKIEVRSEEIRKRLKAIDRHKNKKNIKFSPKAKMKLNAIVEDKIVTEEINNTNKTVKEKVVYKSNNKTKAKTSANKIETKKAATVKKVSTGTKKPLAKSSGVKKETIAKNKQTSSKGVKSSTKNTKTTVRQSNTTKTVKVKGGSKKKGN